MGEARAFVDRLFEVWNTHDVEKATAMYAEDYEGDDVGSATRQVGRDDVRGWLVGYWTAFPDMRFVIDQAVEEPSRISMLWTATGTHQGPLPGLPATGKKVTFRGMTMLTLRNGQVLRGTYIWDAAGMFRMLAPLD